MPQGVPLGMFDWNKHVCSPIEQSVTQFWHGCGIGHAMPAVHAAQAPFPSHTPPGHV
jgi:hypothetical protein